MQQLKDVFQTTTATVALVIATSIFLQMITTKLIAVFERYRMLAAEYRDNPSGPRSGPLRTQVKLDHDRVQIIRRASAALTYAELAFLVCILSASIAAALPSPATILGILGVVMLVVGLVLLGWAAVIELHENRLSKRATIEEIADFDDIADAGPTPSPTK